MPAISKITIDGFKAFPDSFTLDLDGKNLLMYGENGSGKSSIYYALHSLLQSQCKDKNGTYFDPNNAESLVNQHTKKPDAKVTAMFTGSDVTYSISRAGYHESVTQPISPLKDMNGQCVFINHKFLFNVFSFRNSQYIDLFPVFIKDILPFTLTSDKSKYISELYDKIMEGIKKKGNSSYLDPDYVRSIKTFNNELKQVIDKINTTNIPNASLLYNNYFRNADDPELRITLVYDEHKDDIPQPNRSYWLRIGYRFQNDIVAGAPTKVKYSRIKEILQPVITLKVEEKQADGTIVDIKKPQTYFNEAKLTAIALSIRFALLDTITASDGRFLALDDMLISLDMSNRMKVVDYLLNVVADKYKIYLFTHDKSFFEYFMHKSKRSPSLWLYKEIFMQDTQEPHLKNSRTYLGNADFYLKQHEYEIAGNFLRKEAESFCKEFLPKRLHLSADFSQLYLCGLIGNSKRFAEESGMADISLFEELDDQRKFILNPASHDSYDIVKYESEVKKCYDTLTNLRNICFRTIFKKGQKVKFKLQEPMPNNDEYEFEITICDDFRLINQDGHDPIISKGMMNYTISKNGVKGSVQSGNTTLKKFFEKNYNKSDKTISPDFLDSIIDVTTGNPIRTLI